MTVRSDITINWSVSPRIIEVAAPSVELTVQDLYDTLRSLGAGALAIDEPEIIDASGKEVLSATELVGLTVKLLNAKVKFEDRASPTDCDISGGNLVALDDSVPPQPMNPIQHSTNVTVSYAKSTSATLVQSADIDAIKAKTDIIPSDLPEIPTDSELDAQHGVGSWEGATPTQVWGHPQRTVTSREISPTEHISKEETLTEMKGVGWTEETLKTIKELVDELESGVKPGKTPSVSIAEDIGKNLAK